MVLKRSKYGLNTGNSVVNPTTDRALCHRPFSNSFYGPSSRIVKRIVIPTGGDHQPNQQQNQLLNSEQKRQLIEHIEQQLTNHVDGGMQSQIVHTYNGQEISNKCVEQMLKENETEKIKFKQQLQDENPDENEPPVEPVPLCVLPNVSKKIPHGTCVVAPSPQPNANRYSTTYHHSEISYSGNKKKRWELMDDVKDALRANNIDLDTFHGKIVAYTSVPVVGSGANNANGISTFVVANNNNGSSLYGANAEQKFKRVSKNEVVSISVNDENNKLGTGNSGESTVNNNARRQKQPKKSKRTKNQQKTSSSSVNRDKKPAANAAPGIQLVYEFIEPLPKNSSSMELGKRSYWSNDRYNGYGSTSRMYKAQDAIANHLDDKRYVLRPLAPAGNTPMLPEKINNAAVAESAVTVDAAAEDVSEDNSVWGFISAALKKEARTNRTELNRGGWIVLDIMQSDANDTTNNNTSESQDDDDDFEAFINADDDDDVSSVSAKSDTFEKPSVADVVDNDEEEEEADGFVVFDLEAMSAS